jgi:hypothetical protein
MGATWNLPANRKGRRRPFGSKAYPVREMNLFKKETNMRCKEMDKNEAGIVECQRIKSVHQ